jgi:RNA polymerase sigma-70 factor, ECF subfamily
MALAIGRDETTPCLCETRGASQSWSEEAMTPLISRAIGRARVGDLDALRFLYIRYVDDIYDYSCMIVDDHEEAQDITQLVCAKLTSLIDQYEERDVPFGVWIQRVARSLAVDDVQR